MGLKNVFLVFFGRQCTFWSLEAIDFILTGIILLPINFVQELNKQSKYFNSLTNGYITVFSSIKSALSFGRQTQHVLTGQIYVCKMLNASVTST